MSNRHVGKEGLAKRLLLIFVLAAGLGLLARPAEAGTITVAWDLMTETNVTGYRVFVGTSSGRYTQTFDVPATADFFIFRNAFMGVRYYFAVAAEFDGSTIGERSLEVSAVGTRTVGGSLPDGARVSDPATASACGVDCFVVSEVARGLGEISSLAVASNGTIFAVEDGRRVVLLRGGVAVTAFEAAPGTTLRQIALDPLFDTTGRVFVSVLRARDRATGHLEVLRLRHLADALGEPATIISGLSVPLAAAAPLAIGDDALVYVALPSSVARHPYSASVLAFDQDGRVPEGRSSPRVSSGLANPIGLSWDRQGRTVWLAGSTSDGQSLVGSASNGSVPVWSSGSADAAAASLGAAEGQKLLISSGLDVVELTLATGDSVRISLEEYGTPVAAAGAHPGERVVAVRRAGAAGSTYTVFRVADGASAILR